MNNLLKSFADFVYRTNSKRKQFESLHHEKVLAADASKSIKTDNNQDITRGANWVVAQRAVILLTEKQIVCGKWQIPLDSISKATLVKVKSMLGSGQVLKIDTVNNECFQFGMQLNDEWTNQQVLKLEVEEGKMKLSVFSWAVRIIAIAYLLYFLLRKLGIVAG